MTEEMFIDCSEWQRKTFGQSTALSKLSHLKEEVEELEIELHGKDVDKIDMEFADCFILLFGAAAADGMSFEDICSAIEKKMDINRKRIWGKPKENGVVNHIKQAS